MHQLKHYQTLYLLTLLASSALTLNSATAQVVPYTELTSYWGSSGSYIRIGSISPYGQYIVMERKSDSACAFYKIGDTNGLDDDYWFWGGSGSDTFIQIQFSVPACGYTVAPLRYNGYYIDIHGASGSDWVKPPISGGDTWTFGDGHKDEVRSSSYAGSKAEGGGGDDWLWGSSTDTERLYGGDGNDIFCESSSGSTHAAVISGGAGTDCRVGTADTVTGVEQVCSNAVADLCHP